MKKNCRTIIIKYSSRILFSTVILAAVAIISFLLVLLTQSSPSSSFFVIAVDMPPSPSPTSPSQPSAPPATTTGEKPGIVPVPPPPPTASQAIDKLLGGLPKTPPIVEEKIDPKDGDTILSSKIKTDTTVATKVDQESDKKTYDYNRGYLTGIKSILNPRTETPEEFKGSMKSLVQEMKEMGDPKLKAYHLKLYGKVFGPGYYEGFLKGMEDALMLYDMLGIITPKGPNNK